MEIKNYLFFPSWSCKYFIGERNSPFLTEKASLALPTRILGSSKCFQVNKHSLIARKWLKELIYLILLPTCWPLEGSKKEENITQVFTDGRCWNQILMKCWGHLHLSHIESFGEWKEILATAGLRAERQKKTPTAKRNPDLRTHLNLELAAPFLVRYDTSQQVCVLAHSAALLLRGEIMACRGSLTSALDVLFVLKRAGLRVY